jgi:hypothetical protein
MFILNKISITLEKANVLKTNIENIFIVQKGYIRLPDSSNSNKRKPTSNTKQQEEMPQNIKSIRVNTPHIIMKCNFRMTSKWDWH